MLPIPGYIKTIRINGLIHDRILVICDIGEKNRFKIYEVKIRKGIPDIWGEQEIVKNFRTS